MNFIATSHQGAVQTFLSERFWSCSRGHLCFKVTESLTQLKVKTRFL